MPAVGQPEIEGVFRAEHGRAVAVLARVFGDLDIAEEAVQDAFVAAVVRWPEAGLPPSPAGWIITTARNKGHRPAAPGGLPRRPARPGRPAARPGRAGRGGSRGRRPAAPDLHPLPPRPRHRRPGGADPAAAGRACSPPRSPAPSWSRSDHGPAAGPGHGQDPRRRHPLPGPDRGRAAQRPAGARAGRGLPDLQRGQHGQLGRAAGPRGFGAEAIRLGRLLAELLPDEPEVQGLLALLLLVDARRAARATLDGDLVPLADQDRGRWDRDRIAEGQAIVRRCLRRNQPGPYQVQAAIAAVHSDAPTAAATDWRQIVALYDQLLVLALSPVVALNRAVAVAEVEGPAAALVDGLDLDGWYLFHAVRADLLRRLGRPAEAAPAYEAAIARTATAERAFLERRLRTVLRP